MVQPESNNATHCFARAPRGGKKNLPREHRKLMKINCPVWIHRAAEEKAKKVYRTRAPRARVRRPSK